MRRFLYSAMVTLVLLGTVRFPVRAQDSDPEIIAQALVDSLIANDFAAATANFDETMRKALPAVALQQTWDSLIAQVGAFQAQRGTQAQSVPGYTVVVITLQFERMALDVQISVNPTGQVSGLYFVPGKTAPPSEYEPPAYASPDAFTEQEVTIGAGRWVLPGTLTLPIGERLFPAVVLVHGSGPNDRDESVGVNKPFRDLAWGLASNGIAVLRYDKRTLIYGEEMAERYDLTVQDETIDDALAAVALLQATKGIDPRRIFVVGHSLGGYLAPRIVAQNPDIAGIVILAGNTRPLEDLVLEQTEYLLSLDGDLSADDQAQLVAVTQEVEAVKDLSSPDQTTDLLFGAPAAYWIDLRDYVPVTIAQEIPQPMLVLQGERDYQVTMVDLQAWQDGLLTRGDVTFASYPDLNHLFISGEGPSAPAEYGVPGHVAETVIYDIVNWIMTH